MRTLNLKTNYNILLWHFVDSLSKWSPFVSDHTYDYYVSNWDLTQEDKRVLREYALFREALEFQEETALFEWAYYGFKKHPKYVPLLLHIKYFEQRLNKEGIGLNQLLSKALIDVENCHQKLLKELKSLNLDSKVAKLEKLFDFQVKDKSSLDAYLACSFTHTVQGGANGDGIYAEVCLVDNLDDCSIDVIVHEYLHKVLSPDSYFEESQNNIIRKLAFTILEDIHPEKLSGFFEEVVIYSIVDVNFFGNNPAEELDYLTQEKYGYIWKASIEVAPLLKRYLESTNYSIEKTRLELDTKLIELVEKFRKDFKK